MLSKVRFAMLVACLTAGLLSVSAEQASAVCVEKRDRLTGEIVSVKCDTEATDPGKPGDGSGDGHKSSVKDSPCTFDKDNDGDRDVIPCVDEAGVWRADLQCYLKRLDPQPPKSDPDWKGHDDGVLYRCLRPWDYTKSPDGPSTTRNVWFPEAPEQDPAVLAQRAVDSMRLSAVEIGLPVSDAKDRMIYVGAPVWLWVDDPGPRTTGPNRASATAGAVTVSVSARLRGISWDLGEGTTVRCNGNARARGTVYKPSFGLRDSPTCGYRYQHPHRRVTIRAVSHWVVDWAGGGQDGTLTFDLTAQTSRPVGEIQAIVERS